MGGFPNTEPSAVLIDWRSPKRWRTEMFNSPILDSPGGVTVRSLDCDSVNCVAVVDTNHQPSSIYLLTASGRRWTVVRAPLPPNAVQNSVGDQLYQVSCSRSGSCAAVGTFVGTVPGPGGFVGDLLQPLIVYSRGHSWFAAQSPIPLTLADGDAFLDYVACSPSGPCAAIGELLDEEGDHEIAVRGSGRSWAVTSFPAPSLFAEEDDGLACPTANECFAVGVNPLAHPGGVLAMEYDKSKWVAEPIPEPLDTGDSLGPAVYIACPSANVCLGLAGFGRFWLRDNRWHSATAGLPSDAVAEDTSEQSGFSCTSVSACVRVGMYINDRGFLEPFIDESGGSVAASSRTGPVPLGAGSATLRSDVAACSPQKTCVVLGEATSGLTTAPPFSTPPVIAETLFHEKWFARSIDLRGRYPGITFTDMTCPTHGFCLAVGQFRRATDEYARSIYLTLRNQKWRVGRLPTLPTDNGEWPEAAYRLRCVSAQFCTSLSEDPITQNGRTILQDVLLRYSAGNWTIIAGPVSAPYQQISDMVCSSPLDCIAVGYGSDDYPLTPEEGWVAWLTGGRWTVSYVSGQSTDNQDELETIACPDAKLCTAFGTRSHSGQITTVTITLNPMVHRDMSVEPFPGSNQIGGASCLQASACAVPQGGDVLLWNGTGWPSNAPSLGGVGSESDDAYDVSCGTVQCSALVDYVGSSGSPGTAAFIETGERWRTEPITPSLPSLAGDPSASYQIRTIACAPDEACVALGVEYESLGTAYIVAVRSTG